MKTHRNTNDRRCLRHHHESLGRKLDYRPWTPDEARRTQDALLSEAQSLERQADELDPQSAYGPAIRIRDDAARRDHALSGAIAAADVRKEKDGLRRDAMILRGRARSIPQERHTEAYISWMLDYMASVVAYAHLVAQPGDMAGMRAAAERVRAMTVRSPDEVRIAARDLLDRTCQAAGVPQWRKTYGVKTLI